MKLKDYSEVAQRLKTKEFERAQSILDKVQEFVKEDISTRTRIKPIVYPRFVYYNLCRELTRLSYADIGLTIGYDHSAVIHGVKQFQNFELWGLYDLIDLNDDILHQFGYERKLNQARFLREKIELLIQENESIRRELRYIKEKIKK